MLWQDPLCAPPRSRANEGFALIELLVVILIIGILVAVAAPSLLDQTRKAEDSKTQQELTLAWKSAIAGTVANNGQYQVDESKGTSDPLRVQGVLDEINDSEPALNAAAGDYATALTSEGQVFVSPASRAAWLLLYERSASGSIWCLAVGDDATAGGPPRLYAGDNCPGSPGLTFEIPANLVAPVVSGSTAVGESLSATSGDWTGNPTLSYQWLLCDEDGTSCTPITGATGLTYVATVADLGNTVAIRVRAANANGAIYVQSDPVGPIVPAGPQPLSRPTISGVAVVGHTLTATTGGWTGSPSFSYQWRRCGSSALGSCSNVAGATASSYAVNAADVGSRLRVRVTASVGPDANSNSSAVTSAVAAGPYASAVLTTPDLVSYWRLEDAAAATLADSIGTLPLAASGSSFSGALTSQASSAFTGTAQSPMLPAAFLTANEVSFEGWVFLSSPQILAYVGDPNSDGYGLTWSGSCLQLRLGGVTSDAFGCLATTSGTWHYIVLTSDGSNWRLYLDNVFRAETIGVSFNTPSVLKLSLGGTADEVATYSRQLTCGTTTVGDPCATGSDVDSHFDSAS